MKQYRAALAILLVAAGAAMPCAAQEAPAPLAALPNDTCAGCFAYLVFSPPLEPEAYAMGGDAAEHPASPRAAGEPAGRLVERAAGLLARGKQ
jgi:hypothetical protein